VLTRRMDRRTDRQAGDLNILLPPQKKLMYNMCNKKIKVSLKM